MIPVVVAEVHYEMLVAVVYDVAVGTVKEGHFAWLVLVPATVVDRAQMYFVVACVGEGFVDYLYLCCCYLPDLLF